MIDHQNLKPEQQLEVNEMIKLQAYLERKADIDYQCEYLKISREEFWDNYLWSKVPAWIKDSLGITQSGVMVARKPHELEVGKFDSSLCDNANKEKDAIN